MPASWQGNLQLEFAYRHEGTQLSHCRVQAPLKVQRPFYPEGAAVCHSVILHTAGGIVGGDRLSLDLKLHPQAQALVTTAAAGKVYRTNGLEAGQSVRIDVAEGACLEWLPQETIVFNQALYRQDLHVNLAPGSCWLGWEITRLGRTARGEQFVQGSWRSHTEVWQQGEPLWIDRQLLQGSEDLLKSENGLAGKSVIGSFVWIGHTVSPELVEKARTLWLEQLDHHNADTELEEAGVTRLQMGFICRYRGTSTQLARRWFTQVWQLVRLTYLQRSLCLPRVWSL
jgi:urease accessory protein